MTTNGGMFVEQAVNKIRVDPIIYAFVRAGHALVVCFPNIIYASFLPADQNTVKKFEILLMPREHGLSFQCLAYVNSC